MGHFARECPHKGTANQEKSLEKKPLSWPAATIVCLPADTESVAAVIPLVDVSVRGQAASATRKVKGLVDSGATRTLCSKRLVDELYSLDVLQGEDVTMGGLLTFRYVFLMNH